MARPYQRFWLGVEDQEGKAVEAGCQVFVFTAGGTTLATIQKDAQGSATKANPILVATFDADKMVDFFGTVDGTYDILVVHKDGRQARLSGVSGVSGHRIVLPNTQGRHRIFAFGNANTVETDSGQDLAKDEVVTDVLVEVVTAVASATIDVGLLSSETGGDMDGFADAVSAATAGFIRPGVTHTNGTTTDFVSAVTRGTLLATFLVGSDAAASPGFYAEKSHRGDGVAKSLVHNTSNHAIAGYVHILSELAKG